MHYCCLVFTNEFPTDDVIAKKMEPFYEENFYDKDDHKESPTFLWDWYQVGGRYGGRLKMKIDYGNDEYEWKYCAKEPRSGRLFRSKLLEDIRENLNKIGDGWRFSEERILPYCYDESVDCYNVDGCETELLFNTYDIYGYIMIRCDGTAETRNYWDGNQIIENLYYETQVDEEFNKAKYICVIDAHD